MACLPGRQEDGYNRESAWSNIDISRKIYMLTQGEVHFKKIQRTHTKYTQGVNKKQQELIMGHSQKMHGSFGDYVVYTDDNYKTVSTSEERPDGTTEFRNNDGDVTGHSEKGSDLVGHETTEYSDQYGAETGHSIGISDLAGHPTTEYYGNDGGRGTSEKSSDLAGHPTTVYHGDIPGMSKESKESGPTVSSDSSSSSSSSDWSYDSGSGQGSSFQGWSPGTKSAAGPRTNTEIATRTRNAIVPTEITSGESRGGGGSVAGLSGVCLGAKSLGVYLGWLGIGLFVLYIIGSAVKEHPPKPPKKKDRDRFKDYIDSDEHKALNREMDTAVERQNAILQLLEENPDLYNAQVGMGLLPQDVLESQQGSKEREADESRERDIISGMKRAQSTFLQQQPSSGVPVTDDSVLISPRKKTVTVPIFKSNTGARTRQRHTPTSRAQPQQAQVQTQCVSKPKHDWFILWVCCGVFSLIAIFGFIILLARLILS